MIKRFAKATRSRKSNKDEKDEQQSTQRNDPARSAGLDGNDDNDDEEDLQNNTQHPLPQYGINQTIIVRYLIRQRLVNLLEERYPGRWRMMERMGVIYLNAPGPLSEEDLKSCSEGSTSGEGD